jgi:hypothetical protein
MRPTMRAYSHQGHGPRADQTGRIHISDFRNPRTISIAKRSRSIHSGQTRKSPHPDGMSVLASEADIVRPRAQVRFGPQPDSCIAAISRTIRPSRQHVLKETDDQLARRLTAFSGTISALKRNSCGSAGSTEMRTQWLSGQPKVSTRVKFSNRRLVFLL